MITIVDKIDSTNNWLRNFGSNYFDSIVSFEQLKGYGRLGRVWESKLGGLYYSLVLPYNKILPIIVGVSVSDILTRYNLNIRLKWPNDIIVNGKKLGGILCQTQGKNTIVGLGINVSNKSNLSYAANLSDLGCDLDKLNFIDMLSKKIAVVMKWKDQEIIDKFSTYDCLIGKHISWFEGKGKVEKISKEGHLVVRDNNNQLVFLTDEVHLE